MPDERTLGGAQHPRQPTGRFLRENWAWIVGPIVLVLVLLVVLALASSGDESSTFVYPIS